MKFSKIACVALLSASISTVALAQQQQPRQTKLELLEEYKKDEATRTAAYDTIIKAISELKSIGYNNLKDWSGEKGTNADINAKIYGELEKIQTATKSIKNTQKELKVTSDTSTLIISQNGDIKVFINGNENTQVKGSGGDNDPLVISLETFANTNKDNIQKMFAENNEDVWKAFLKEFKTQHQKEQELRLKAIDQAALRVVRDSSADQVTKPDDRYSLFIANRSLVENAANKNLQDSQETLEKAMKAVNQTIKNVDTKVVTLLSKDIKKIGEQEKRVSDILNQINTAKQKPKNQEGNIEKATALKAAIKEGVKLQTKTVDGRDLTIADIDAIYNGNSHLKLNEFDNGNVKDLTGDENKGKVLDALLGDIAQKTGAAHITNEAKKELEKISDKIEAEKVEEAEIAIQEAKGVIAKYASESAKATSDEGIANAKSKALNTAIKDKKPSDEIAKAQQELKNAANARATGVTKVANLEEKQGEVLGSFTDTVLANDTVKSIVTSYNAKELADTAKALNTSIEQSQRSQNKGTSTDIIMFNTGLATNTRLAKLSNPFNADLALAQAINELEGETFADAGDSLSSVIKEYTNRFNHDNNLWGNIFGGKGKIKDSANPSIWGVTLGYDKAFDNTIVGGFINYAKVQSKDSQVRSESDNYSFGVYSRSYFDQSEIDAKIGYGFGRNELSRHAMDSKIGTSTGKYDSKFFDVDVEYGYVFGLGNAMFIKPIAGLSYTHIKHDGFTEDGNVPAIFGNTTLKTLKAKLGSEFRVYTDNAGYFYITPGVERELSKSANDLSVKFVGSSKDVVFDADKKKNTYITLKTGAEFKITNNLSTNINFGAKAKAKEQYYNGTLGVSYKF
ncbi:autotransporter domain-containing protein [Campylobacter mucosalis]|uniref:autotransporter domain-containing protein n=1 Tax=Campylobacter mucosalis TaxID=202 RepID=UPI00159327FE|nr:autotransporter domain-containing protein [Campylobacter mucosalis]QKF62447.1 autotransporter domain-containing protein [Campylobacter mucosalis]